VSSLGDQPLQAVAALAARPGPGPSGGACAAIACALAAGLVEMVATLTPSAGEMAGAAAEMRAHALALADDDVDAYGAVVAAHHLPAGAQRERRLAESLSGAADPPLAIAELGARLTGLARDVERDARADLAGDLAVATRLAEAASTGAARLVAINLAGHPQDPRARRAAELMG
jgi:methenyltetrahydrofolate cyclohydrolase